MYATVGRTDVTVLGICCAQAPDESFLKALGGEVLPDLFSVKFHASVAGAQPSEINDASGLTLAV